MQMHMPGWHMRVGTKAEHPDAAANAAASSTAPSSDNQARWRHVICAEASRSHLLAGCACNLQLRVTCSCHAGHLRHLSAWKRGRVDERNVRRSASDAVWAGQTIDLATCLGMARFSHTHLPALQLHMTEATAATSFTSATTLVMASGPVDTCAGFVSLLCSSMSSEGSCRVLRRWSVTAA